MDLIRQQSLERPMDRGQLCRGIWESSSAKVVAKEPNGCSRVTIQGNYGGYALVPCKLGELLGATRQDGKNEQAVLVATIIVEEGSCA